LKPSHGVLSGRLAPSIERQQDVVVWRRREPPLDRQTVDGIIRMLMDINAKLDRLLGWEDEENSAEDGS
jgi:hypothetical protein